MSDAPVRRGVPWKRIGCAVALAALIAVVVAVRHVVWSMGESERVSLCRNNLSQLAQAYLERVVKNPAEAQRCSGPAMWLVMRKGVADILPGNERVFICPDDDDASVPSNVKEMQRWDDVDLDHVPRDLCSYAGRDFVHFPVSAAANHPPEPIGACVSHRNFAIVVYDDGDSRCLERAELGMAPDDDITVGPESKSPVLRVLRYGDGSVR